ncbi:MAG: hypothetical protein ACP5G6_08840, partial [Conexivisphaera sp.]
PGMDWPRGSSSTRSSGPPSSRILAPRGEVWRGCVRPPELPGDLLRRGVICRWISGYARRFFDAYYGL